MTSGFWTELLGKRRVQYPSNDLCLILICMLAVPGKPYRCQSYKGSHKLGQQTASFYICLSVPLFFIFFSFSPVVGGEYSNIKMDE